MPQSLYVNPFVPLRATSDRQKTVLDETEKLKLAAQEAAMREIERQRQLAQNSPPPFSIGPMTTGAQIGEANNQIAQYNAAKDFTNDPYKQLNLLQSGGVEASTGSPYDAKWAQALYQSVAEARNKQKGTTEEDQIKNIVKQLENQRYGSNNVLA